MIRIHGLTKSYPAGPWGGKTPSLAFRDVHLRIAAGEIFALLGPNGSGKTSLLKTLATLLTPSEGEAWIAGYPLSAGASIRRVTGFVGTADRSFYFRLTVAENLRFFASLAGLSSAEFRDRLHRLVPALALEEILHQRFDHCSTGMRSRVALARALLHRPRVLLLDEPTRSLDPVATFSWHQGLRDLVREEECAVLHVTHNPQEAAAHGDRVGVMVEGQLRVIPSETSPSEIIPAKSRVTITLRQKQKPKAFSANKPVGEETLISPPNRSESVLGESVGTGSTPSMGDLERREFHLEDPARELDTLLGSLGRENLEVVGVESSPPTWKGVLKTLESPPPPDEPPAGLPQEGFSLGNLMARSWAFLRRDAMTQWSYRTALVLDLLGILLAVASPFFIGRFLGDAVAPRLATYGGSYFAFVLVGIALFGFHHTALRTYADAIRQGQLTGTLEAMMSTGTGLPTLLLGSSLWGFAFNALRVAAFLGLGALFFGLDLSRASLPAAVAILGLAVVAESAIGIFSAAFVLVFKKGDPFRFAVSSASALLAGIYYPVETLPLWMQTLAQGLPLTHSLAGLRGALLEGKPLSQLGSEVAALAIFASIFLPLSLLVFRLAAYRVRRQGSLAQY